MYRPFDNTCSHCKGTMHPMDELFPDNTHPTPRNKEITVVFWCQKCNHAENYTYVLPKLTDDVSKNLLMLLNKYVKDNDVLGSDVTLDTTEFMPLAQQGVQWALADLQQKGLLYDVDGTTFKISILGHLMRWHGPY